MKTEHQAGSGKFNSQRRPMLESELKFIQNCYLDKQTRRSLGNICRPDEKFRQNIIFSVYFDTYDWYMAGEKASSDYEKAKVRVRWYASADNMEVASPCFLEIKQKIGSKRLKHRLSYPATSENIMDMLMQREGLHFVQNSVAKIIPEMSGFPLAPKMMVRYNRSRYYEPLSRTRVAFDTDIHGMLVGSGTFLNSRQVKLPYSVLEVKGYQDEIPHTLRNINTVNLKKAAFSKYYECFLLLTDY